VCARRLPFCAGRNRQHPVLVKIGGNFFLRCHPFITADFVILIRVQERSKHFVHQRPTHYRIKTRPANCGKIGGEFFHAQHAIMVLVVFCQQFCVRRSLKDLIRFPKI
jgi:hypothetical protein